MGAKIKEAKLVNNIEVPIDLKAFIDSQVPKSVRRMIVPNIQKAYDLVNASLNEVSFLKWTLGKKHRGYLDNIAVQFVLYEACNKGEFGDIKAQVVPNTAKSAYHVELYNDDIIICINRAKNEHTTARKAIYRSILQTSNQLYFNLDKFEVMDEPGYLELTHNHKEGKVNFINIGVPNGKGKWVERIDLTKELYVLDGSEKEKENKITREQLVKFKNFAQGVLQDGGES